MILINVSEKEILLEGILLWIVDSDLEDKLIIFGYENDDEEIVKIYLVDYDVMIVEWDGIEVWIVFKDV